MRIGEALQGISSILLDTSPLVYYVEQHPVYGPLMCSFFRIRAERSIDVVTTPVTLSECLVLPVHEGMHDLAATYRAVLLRGQGSVFRTLGSREADMAAQIRAQCNLRLPDAFQVAAALSAGCQAILTNDLVFKRVASPQILVLDELEP
jgi:predicted nucleic acid-binding protein